jgi:hypothetical protein
MRMSWHQQGRLGLIAAACLAAILFALAFGYAESSASTTTSTHRDACDGADNDGDGLTDEGWSTVLGTDAPTTRDGVVPDGTWICASDGQGITNSTLWADPPVTEDDLVEVCNGNDDDMDSLVDEAWNWLGSNTAFGGIWDCSADTQALLATGWADDAFPTVDLEAPLEGSSFPMGTVVAADFSCADPTAGTSSGLGSCVGTAADGSPIDTSATGEHSFTVVAEDNVGNRTTETVSYTVTTAPAGDATPPATTDDRPAPLKACLAKAKRLKGKQKRKRSRKKCRKRFG